MCSEGVRSESVNDKCACSVCDVHAGRGRYTHTQLHALTFKVANVVVVLLKMSQIEGLVKLMSGKCWKEGHSY